MNGFLRELGFSKESFAHPGGFMLVFSERLKSMNCHLRGVTPLFYSDNIYN